MGKSKNYKAVKFKTIKFFDYKIFVDKITEVDCSNLGIVNTINAYSFFVAEQNKAVHRALINSDIIIPDGTSVCLGIKFLHSKIVKKIAGYDLLLNLLIKANSNGCKVFFLGSSDKTLHKIKANILKSFPKIDVNILNPGFNKNIDDFDNQNIIKTINKAKPDILFVGLSAPKQEIWVYNFKENLKVGTICSVGAAFDYFAETKKRPSNFWINMGFEGVIRTIKEPKTQIKKDIKAYPYLIYRLLKEKIKRCIKKQP